MILIGQPLWALIPWLAIIIMTTGSIQSHQTSIQSVQQFATDNIMLLSRLTLMFASVWMMYLSGYDVIISAIYVSIITVIIYCIALSLNYIDGTIIRHQASVVWVIGTTITAIIMIMTDMSSMQQYWGILTIFMTIIATIVMTYIIMSHYLWRELPDTLRDEAIGLRTAIIPISIIITVFSHDIMRACTLSLLWYACSARTLSQLNHHYYPAIDTEELTLDLILKWYKTTHISQITRYSWINTAFHTISQIQDPIRFIIQRIPDGIMIIAYLYFITQLLSSWVSMADFIIYCVGFLVYIWLPYLFQMSSVFEIDTLSQWFIIGYLSIIALMMTVFTSDPIAGSIIGIVWVIINALIVAQYHRLWVQQYIQPHHVKRRVRANTAWAAVIIGVMIQLPIDSIMIIPLILIVLAILWFTIAQSYITLRTLK